MHTNAIESSNNNNNESNVIWIDNDAVGATVENAIFGIEIEDHKWTHEWVMIQKW